MYVVNLLNETEWQWEPLMFKGRPMTFSSKSTLMRALKNNLGVSQQILYNDHFLMTLDGTPHNLEWFVRNHDRLVDKANYCFPKSNEKSKVKKLGGC